jgi:fumarate hydratase class II
VTAAQEYRIEKDSMGEVRVPATAKWRAQTQRAVENFPISGRPIERELIGALASIKGASAAIRATKGTLDSAKAQAIHAVAVEVARGDWDARTTTSTTRSRRTTSSRPRSTSPPPGRSRSSSSRP